MTAEEFEVVDCADPAAAYEVVDKDTEKKRSKLDACEDFPEGIEIDGPSSGSRKTYTQVCAVPIDKAG